MSKAFKTFEHCGDNYYIGINSHITPTCAECGEQIETEPIVEVYEDNILNDTKPVETFKSVEEYRND